jgi:hypothetical protein
VGFIDVLGELLDDDLLSVSKSKPQWQRSLVHTFALRGGLGLRVMLLVLLLLGLLL